MKNNFKIISIKALEDCNTDFTKVLEKEKLYYFYSDYKIIVKDEYEEIFFEETSPSNLYSINGKNNKINVNISAIVGKNGSGKSSIVELLLRTINNLAYNYLKASGKPLKTITAKLKLVDDVNVVFYYHSDSFYKVEINNAEFKIYKFDPENKLMPTTKSIHRTFELANLFYTEIINYSHYAYNSSEFGFFKNGIFVDWLKELFHKNDSYQTPVVLNPMRTEGTSEINRENDLVKQRLLANIFRKDEGNLSFRKFGDNLNAKSIKFKLKEKKSEFSIWIDNKKGLPVERKYNLGVYSTRQRRRIIVKLMEKLANVSDFDANMLNNGVYPYAEMYIIYKITSICKKYGEYEDFFDEKLKKIPELKEEDLIRKLKNDDSHITFKLKQTLNYLKNDYINFEGHEIIISITELSKQINTVLKKNQSMLEVIPPPIFDIEILLENSKSKEEVQFKTLSSGEKQLIYMVSSLLYHLYNLDSVTGNKVKYKNINIVLEEIELYFHPDYQKAFLKYFLDSIERIELRNIESVNICILTHSPFILSDIPSNNIMFLEVIDGKSVQHLNKRKTFGANIHELLTDNFFMKNGFIGDFAKNKIDKTINWINKELHQKKEFEKNEVSVRYSVDKEDCMHHKGIISLIDEPILKLKLSDMLSELDGDDDFYDDIILEQMKNLEKRLKKKKLK